MALKNQEVRPEKIIELIVIKVNICNSYDFLFFVL